MGDTTQIGNLGAGGAIRTHEPLWERLWVNDDVSLATPQPVDQHARSAILSRLILISGLQDEICLKVLSVAKAIDRAVQFFPS